jgi:hypothetical protein
VARRHQAILAKLDPVALVRYQITENDIQTVERYLKIIQATLERAGVSLWQQIGTFPGVYATSLVVHELVEIRLLQAKGIDPLNLDTFTLRQPWSPISTRIFKPSTTNIFTCKITSTALTSSFSRSGRA